MTREEAINWLKQISDRYIHGGDESYDEKRKEAIDMAISVLRTQADMPPNDPLTLEQLREMDGEPVWVVSMENMFASCWMLVWIKNNFVLERFQFCNFMDYGKTWLAYRRRPEEGRT